MKISITESEKHPIKPQVIEQGAGDRLIKVYGLKKTRGDNCVFSTRITDAYFDVLKKYGLTNYLYGEEERGFNPNEEKRRFTEATGSTIDFLGVAYNIRQEYDAAKYEAFIKELAEAMA